RPVLRRLPRLRPGPGVHRAGGHRPGPALQPGLARRGVARPARGALAPRRHLGLHLRRRVDQGVSQARRPGRRHPAPQADRPQGVVPVLGDAEGEDMNQPHTSTEFHPRWYRRRVSAYWWLQRGSYLRFILRELSSVFIGYTVALLLAQIYALGQGKEAYEVFG